MLVSNFNAYKADHRLLLNRVCGHRLKGREITSAKPLKSDSLSIYEASASLTAGLSSENDAITATLAMRQEGLLVSLTDKETMNYWLIPYYRLSIYKTETWSIHSEGLSLRLIDKQWSQSDFFSNLLNWKSIQIEARA